MEILELLSYTIPTIVTGVIAYYFFKLHTKNEHSRRAFDLMKEKQGVALPMRLQAYERMTLFLERISPAKLLIRIKPSGTDKVNYQKKLVSAIETEFEHNLVQQIYLTNQCWNVIVTAKNSTLNIIRATTANTGVEDARALQEHILQELVNKEPPSNAALAFIKEEVHKIF